MVVWVFRFFMCTIPERHITLSQRKISIFYRLNVLLHLYMMGVKNIGKKLSSTCDYTHHQSHAANIGNKNRVYVLVLLFLAWLGYLVWRLKYRKKSHDECWRCPMILLFCKLIYCVKSDVCSHIDLMCITGCLSILSG